MWAPMGRSLPRRYGPMRFCRALAADALSTRRLRDFDDIARKKKDFADWR